MCPLMSLCLILTLKNNNVSLLNPVHTHCLSPSLSLSALPLSALGRLYRNHAVDPALSHLMLPRSRYPWQRKLLAYLFSPSFYDLASLTRAHASIIDTRLAVGRGGGVKLTSRLGLSARCAGVYLSVCEREFFFLLLGDRVTKTLHHPLRRKEDGYIRA